VQEERRSGGAWEEGRRPVAWVEEGGAALHAGGEEDCDMQGGGRSGGAWEG